MDIFKRVGEGLTGRSGRYLSLSFSIVKILKQSVLSGIKMPSITTSEMESRYQKLAESFSPEFSKRLSNYVLTTRVIWGICLSILVASIVMMSFVVMLEALALIGFVWVFLGYRIWILTEKKYPPISQYLKLFPQTWKSALPLNTNRLMD